VAQYVPEGHESHALEPVALSYVPATHVEHDDALATENRPMAHDRHDVGPVSDVYLPAAHEEHAEAPALEYLPAAQLPLTAERPVDAQ